MLNEQGRSVKGASNNKMLKFSFSFWATFFINSGVYLGGNFYCGFDQNVSNKEFCSLLVTNILKSVLGDCPFKELSRFMQHNLILIYVTSKI